MFDEKTVAHRVRLGALRVSKVDLAFDHMLEACALRR